MRQQHKHEWSPSGFGCRQPNRNSPYNAAEEHSSQQQQPLKNHPHTHSLFLPLPVCRRARQHERQRVAVLVKEMRRNLGGFSVLQREPNLVGALQLEINTRPRTSISRATHSSRGRRTEAGADPAGSCFLLHRSRELDVQSKCFALIVFLRKTTNSAPLSSIEGSLHKQHATPAGQAWRCRATLREPRPLITSTKVNST